MTERRECPRRRRAVYLLAASWLLVQLRQQNGWHDTPHKLLTTSTIIFPRKFPGGRSWGLVGFQNTFRVFLLSLRQGLDTATITGDHS